MPPRPTVRFTAPASRDARAHVVALVALATLSACRVQAVPGPMPALVDPLPPGEAAAFEPGPTEVEAIRHGSPVQVRRAGTNGYFPLRAHAKRIRLSAGASIATGTGGRAELIWPGSPTIVILFDDCIAAAGEPTRDEPLVTFLQLGSARLRLTEHDRVRLPGGCELVAEVEPGLVAGPIKLSSPDRDTVRLENQSTALFRVAFRDEELLVSPGEVLDVPILDDGSAPIRVAPPVRLDAGSFEVTARDELQAERVPGGIRLQAAGGTAVRALGVGVRLEPGAEVTFLELDPPTGAPPLAGALEEIGVSADKAVSIGVGGAGSGSDR